MRSEGRASDRMRLLKLTRGVSMHAEGSVLIEMGATKVLCTASVEERVPPFLRDSGRGWVTAEYAMLPRSTNTRTPREARTGRVDGRGQEIQRLIGRSLRAVTRLDAFGERTVWLECDVIQADGGTRCASITGAFVALAEAFEDLKKKGGLKAGARPLCGYVAAVSLGIVDGELLLDLAYEEDSRAEVDMNIVMTGERKVIEIQGTAEKTPFEVETLGRMVELGWEGIRELTERQRETLAELSVLP